MAEARTALDWQEAYARLEQTRQRLDASSALSPEEVRRLLRERAQELARPLVEAQTAIDVLDLAVFVLAGARYGIEAAHVLEVMPLCELTPVPCTPPHILGVMNHRGRILPILDFRRLFALAADEVTAESRVVAVQASGMTFGILADAVLGTMRVGAHEVMPPPVTLLHDQQAALRGVTGDMVEAAKAGEAGRGFAVVAAEVKALAEQSKQATAQVRGILGEIQRATQAAVMATEQGVKAAEAGEKVAQGAGESIRLLAQNVHESAQVAQQILVSTQQQVVGMDQIVIAIQNIQQVSTQNMTATRQVERAAQDLNELSQQL